MSNKLLGILVVVLGLVLLTRIFVSGTLIFLVIAALLALAASTGSIGRTGYVLAGIFVLLSFAGIAMRTVGMAFAMLFRLAPLLAVLIGIYMVAKAIRR